MPEYSQMARSLWEDAAVVECFRRRAKFGGVCDNLPYFMGEAFDRISGPDYIPTQQDILNMTKNTSGNTYTARTV